MENQSKPQKQILTLNADNTGYFCNQL